MPLRNVKIAHDPKRKRQNTSEIIVHGVAERGRSGLLFGVRNANRGDSLVNILAHDGRMALRPHSGSIAIRPYPRCAKRDLGLMAAIPPG